MTPDRYTPKRTSELCQYDRRVKMACKTLAGLSPANARTEDWQQASDRQVFKEGMPRANSNHPGLQRDGAVLSSAFLNYKDIITHTPGEVNSFPNRDTAMSPL